MKSKADLTVYFDGLCKVCSKEIAHYRQQRGAERIAFIDICAPGFDPAQLNLDPVAVHKVMHARRRDGALTTRVDAFIEIWRVLPKYHWLAKIATLPLVKFGLEIGYSCFAVIRPLLPRLAKADDCQDSPYCEVKNAKTAD